MNRISSRLARIGLAAPLVMLADVASAHPGHDAHGLLHGMAHPFGADHLLAMVAVGMWSAVALPARKAWLGPLTFMLALVAGAALGMQTGALAGIEPLVALSVVLFGVLLAGARRWSVSAGLSLVAASALVHGMAHGAEWPLGVSAASYVAGFLCSTLALHVAGLGLGTVLRDARGWAWRVAGALVGSAGLLLLARV